MSEQGVICICPLCAGFTSEIPYSRMSRCSGCGQTFTTTDLREAVEPEEAA